MPILYDSNRDRIFVLAGNLRPLGRIVSVQMDDAVIEEVTDEIVLEAIRTYREVTVFVEDALVIADEATAQTFQPNLINVFLGDDVTLTEELTASIVDADQVNLWVEEHVLVTDSVSTALTVSRASDVPQLELIIVDSSPFVVPPPSPNNNAAELWGYSRNTLVNGYSGAPDVVTRLPNVSWAGRGHGLCLASSGHIFVVTSESSLNGNRDESLFLLYPGSNGVLTQAQAPRFKCERIFAGTSSETEGLRDVVELGDGTFLVGSYGNTGPHRYARFTLEQALNDDMDGLPIYTMPLSLQSYDLVTVPGTRQVWFNGDNQIVLIDFSGPSGAAPLLKHASGSNIGRPVNEWWYGFLALAANGYLWKQRGAVPDIAGWSPATLNALTTTPTNPAPDIVITSTVFTSLPSNESMISCIAFDDDGNLWVASNTSNRYQTLNLVQSAHLWRFPAAAVLAGGAQTPDITVTLPNWTQPWVMKSPVRRLSERISITDTTSVSRFLSRSLSDTLNIIDSLTVQEQGSLSEEINDIPIVITDTVIISKSLTVTVSDTISITDDSPSNNLGVGRLNNPDWLTLGSNGTSTVVGRNVEINDSISIFEHYRTVDPDGQFDSHMDQPFLLAGKTDPIVKPIVLWTTYFNPVDGVITVDGWTEDQVVDNYSGPAQVTLQVLHDSESVFLIVTDTNHMILTVWEAPSETSASRGWIIIPPEYLVPGAYPTTRTISSSQYERILVSEFAAPVNDITPRASLQLRTGEIIVGARTTMAKLSLERLLAHDNLNTVPVWHTDGSNGEAVVNGQFWISDPFNALSIWHQGLDKLSRQNINQAPGLITPDKVVSGNNIGATPIWGGEVAFDSLGGMWLVRSDRNDIAYFDPSQVNFMGLPATNPVPAKVLTSPVFSARNPNVESLWLLKMDVFGRLWVGTDQYEDNNPQKSAVFIFSSEALDAAGSQNPVLTMFTRPDMYSIFVVDKALKPSVPPVTKTMWVSHQGTAPNGDPEAPIKAVPANQRLVTGEPVVVTLVPGEGSTPTVSPRPIGWNFDQTGGLWFLTWQTGDEYLRRIAPEYLLETGSPPIDREIKLPITNGQSLERDANGNFWCTDGLGTYMKYTPQQLAVSSPFVTVAPSVSVDFKTALQILTSNSWNPQTKPGRDGWAYGVKYNQVTGPSDYPAAFAISPAQLASGGVITPVGICTGSNFAGGPDSITQDINGKIWIAFYDGDRIARYSAAAIQAGGNPAPEVVITSPDIVGPGGIEFDDEGTLWISNYDRAEVVGIKKEKLNASGSVAVDVKLSTGTNQPIFIVFQEVYGAKPAT